VRRRTRLELVDDAVAETFLVACRRPGAVPEDPLPWLLGVARRVIATQRRSERRRAALRLKLFGADRSDAEAPIGASPTYSAGHAALAGLSEADREAIALIAWDGLTTTQAAAVLGISPVAFRARLSRARKRLRKQLPPELTSSAENAEPSPVARKEAVQ
jgi:RNA polymerase sigma-70 factor (ECF subfamily)